MGKPIDRGAKVATLARRQAALARPELDRPSKTVDPVLAALSRAAAAGFVGRASEIFAALVKGQTLCIGQPLMADVLAGKHPAMQYWLEPSGEALPQDAALTVARSEHVYPNGDGLFARQDVTASQTFRAKRV